MAAGDGRQGRRDNGLVASEYAAAGDVDPRVGEHLLDVLAIDGIAAYLRPSTDLHPVTRTNTLPDRPTDRLYVDRAHLATARGLIARLGTDEAVESRSQDDAWAQIVAGFHATPVPDARTWPEAENRDDDRDDHSRDDFGREDRDERGPGGPVVVVRPAMSPRGPDEDAPSLLDALDTFGADLPAGPEEHYTPPPPPPLPRPALPTILGALGVVFGFIVFLSPGILPLVHTTALVVGFAAIAGGAVTLIWRLRPGTDDDDIDPDDGARV